MCIRDSLNTTQSAHNVGLIFDENLTFSDPISSLSRSCYYHIRQLRCICPYLDFKTSNTITASILHFKLDYCNSLCFNLLKTQINRLQQIQNSLVRTVANTFKYSQLMLHNTHSTQKQLKCTHAQFAKNN